MSVVCDDGNFSFPKECRAYEAQQGEGVGKTPQITVPFHKGDAIANEQCLLMRTSAALVYKLQVNLYCTRWHELCDDGRFISPKTNASE